MPQKKEDSLGAPGSRANESMRPLGFREPPGSLPEEIFQASNIVSVEEGENLLHSLGFGDGGVQIRLRKE